MNEPPEFWIGSAMSIATVSAPSNSSTSSISASRAAVNAASSWPSGCR